MNPPGVSTAIIVFAKGGKTENVFFYDVQSDGYTLDDKRLPERDGKNDLPDVMAKYRRWCEGEAEFANRTLKAFEVSVEDLRDANYDLSISRYRIAQKEATKHADPRVLLAHLLSIEEDIHADIKAIMESL